MAEPTKIEKSAGELTIKTLPPATEKDGKYEQVMPSSDGTYTKERHVYVGPDGIGYTDIVTMVKDGRTWRYTEHHGPETFRDENSGKWVDATPEEVK